MQDRGGMWGGGEVKRTYKRNFKFSCNSVSIASISNKYASNSSRESANKNKRHGRGNNILESDI